jgi:hypothetical protein
MSQPKTKQLFERLEAYLKPALDSAVAQWNIDDPTLYLETVAEWDKGYKDVLAGLSEYPAILFMEQSRTHNESFTTTYTIEISLALKGGDTIADKGEAYADILERALLADHHLGSTCLDSNDLIIETGMVGRVFLVVATIDLDIDRGGFV